MNDEEFYYFGRRYGEAFVEHELGEYDSKITKVTNYGCDSEGCLLEFLIDNKDYVTLRITEIPPISDDNDDWFMDAKYEVELGEDYFEQIKNYDYTIKYFWIALLSK